VVKVKGTKKLSCPAAPSAVLEKSYADVSFLAGLLIDKFRYHLPLYRQHQRLLDSGIQVSRQTLTNLVHRTVDLLEPIYYAQLSSILQSSVITMDETPIKATRNRDQRKMHTAYYWPVYGEQDEIVFLFSLSRASPIVKETLGAFGGVLLTDGYKVYERYVAKTENLTHAQCWAHTRRKFMEAESTEPNLSKQALDQIGQLYAIEDQVRKKKPKEIEDIRMRESRPVVEGLFAWLRSTVEQKVLLHNDPFTKAAHYALQRERALQVYLKNPKVPIDTNHIERQIRPLALGRKNWMFCWTEIGARYVGMVNSLIATCRQHQIDPYTYLVDVLQRIDTHPAMEVHRLTPRLWKDEFANQPLRSDIDIQDS
jgi:hypothetical protein